VKKRIALVAGVRYQLWRAATNQLIRNMYSWVSTLKIRKMESQLYGGPETVEHAFECEDDFQSVHVRRRDGTDYDSRARPAGGAAVWYVMVYDPVRDEMHFEEGDPGKT
jgi:hypothetical protein